MIEGKPRESLVQYEAAIELGNDVHQNDPFASQFSSSKKKGQLQPLESQPKQEDFLNAVLPPREWGETGKHMIQYVSKQPASRVDVARLREMLD
mmetsp:Transcript_15658/g.21222  ORF Transcript_15658/g.21222 Transcript_15658/m.21222 type:complete len:94 (+) Transcript_15658:34-315(+)